MKSDLSKNALEATDFLKAMAHDGRLQILCLLLGGEKSVSEIETTSSMRQAAALTSAPHWFGWVKARWKSIYYRIADERVLAIVKVLYDLFCSEDAKK